VTRSAVVAAAQFSNIVSDLLRKQLVKCAQSNGCHRPHRIEETLKHLSAMNEHKIIMQKDNGSFVISSFSQQSVKMLSSLSKLYRQEGLSERAIMHSAITTALFL